MNKEQGIRKVNIDLKFTFVSDNRKQTTDLLSPNLNSKSLPLQHVTILRRF